MTKQNKTETPATRSTARKTLNEIMGSLQELIRNELNDIIKDNPDKNELISEEIIIEDVSEKVISNLGYSVEDVDELELTDIQPATVEPVAEELEEYEDDIPVLNEVIATPKPDKHKKPQQLSLLPGNEDIDLVAIQVIAKFNKRAREVGEKELTSRQIRRFKRIMREILIGTKK